MSHVKQFVPLVACHNEPARHKDVLVFGRAVCQALSSLRRVGASLDTYPALAQEILLATLAEDLKGLWVSGHTDLFASSYHAGVGAGGESGSVETGLAGAKSSVSRMSSASAKHTSAVHGQHQQHHHGPSDSSAAAFPYRAFRTLLEQLDAFCSLCFLASSGSKRLVERERQVVAAQERHSFATSPWSSLRREFAVYVDAVFSDEACQACLFQRDQLGMTSCVTDHPTVHGSNGVMLGSGHGDTLLSSPCLLVPHVSGRAIGIAHNEFKTGVRDGKPSFRLLEQQVMQQLGEREHKCKSNACPEGIMRRFVLRSPIPRIVFIGISLDPLHIRAKERREALFACLEDALFLDRCFVSEDCDQRDATSRPSMAYALAGMVCVGVGERTASLKTHDRAHGGGHVKVHDRSCGYIRRGDDSEWISLGDDGSDVCRTLVGLQGVVDDALERDLYPVILMVQASDDVGPMNTGEPEAVGTSYAAHPDPDVQRQSNEVEYSGSSLPQSAGNEEQQPVRFVSENERVEGVSGASWVGASSEEVTRGGPYPQGQPMGVYGYQGQVQLGSNGVAMDTNNSGVSPAAGWTASGGVPDAMPSGARGVDHSHARFGGPPEAGRVVEGSGRNAFLDVGRPYAHNDGYYSVNGPGGIQGRSDSAYQYVNGPRGGPVAGMYQQRDQYQFGGQHRQQDTYRPPYQQPYRHHEQNVSYGFQGDAFGWYSRPHQGYRNQHEHVARGSFGGPSTMAPQLGEMPPGRPPDQAYSSGMPPISRFDTLNNQGALPSHMPAGPGSFGGAYSGESDMRGMGMSGGGVGPSGSSGSPWHDGAERHTFQQPLHGGHGAYGNMSYYERQWEQPRQQPHMERQQHAYHPPSGYGADVRAASPSASPEGPRSSSPA